MENPTEQLLNEAEVQAAQTVKKEKKVQKVSKSYTVKAFGENIAKIIKMGYVSEADGKILMQIQKKTVEAYVKETFK